jgi:hypothetical protein
MRYSPIILLSLLAVLVMSLILYVYNLRSFREEPKGPFVEIGGMLTPLPSLPTSPTPEVTIQLVTQPPSPASAKSSVNLAVPFTVQAPYANWELPYKETCEEASVLMVARFLKDKPITGPSDADQAILAIIDWQKLNFGFYEDTDAAQTAEFAQQIFGFELEVITLDRQRIVSELSSGRPVIVPADGRILPNPYFRSPGPPYHMFVIRGFERNGEIIITNDPGTKRGEGFKYTYTAIEKAAGDFVGSAVDTSKKVMLVIKDS